jgi:two-component system sensor histidine kinase KdpD
VRDADQVHLVDHDPRGAAAATRPRQRVPAPTGWTQRSINYFRLGNLAALRELALMWVADRVDEAIQRYRERTAASKVRWETRERVVVAITGAPEQRARDPPGRPDGAPKPR